MTNLTEAVPKEPTETMILVGDYLQFDDHEPSIAERWQAMIKQAQAE